VLVGGIQCEKIADELKKKKKMIPRVKKIMNL